MDGVQRQQADGSWVPAEPLPWVDGIDWEVQGRSRNRSAVAYWHDQELGRVLPGRLFRLRLLLTHRRLRSAANRQRRLS